MAIAKSTTSGVCPAFCGRALNRGFVIQGPYKTFLTSEPANIASERCMVTVFNYDLAEYVKSKAADVRGFGVYCETGLETDAITVGKHIYAADLYLKVTEDYSLGPGQQHNCDVRSASIRIETQGAISGVVHGLYLNARLQAKLGGRTYGGFYLALTPTYGGIGLEVRTEIIGDPDTVATVGAAAYGFVGILLAHKNDRSMIGNYAAIAIHVPVETVAITGTTYGIRFDTDGLWTGTPFDVGINFGTGLVRQMINGAVVPEAGGSDAAVRIKTTVTTGLSVADHRGLYIETEVTGTGINTGTHEGMKIETYVEAGATITDHHYGAHISTMDARTGNRNIYPLRLEHNGAAVALGAMCIQGAFRYFFITSTQGEAWISKSGTPTGEAGWIRIEVGQADRYIQLFSSPGT